jgi:hypothetical protein
MLSETGINNLKEKLSAKLATIFAQQGNYLTFYFWVKIFDRIHIIIDDVVCKDCYQKGHKNKGFIPCPFRAQSLNYKHNLKYSLGFLSNNYNEGDKKKKCKEDYGTKVVKAKGKKKRQEKTKSSIESLICSACKGRSHKNRRSMTCPLHKRLVEYVVFLLQYNIACN